MVPYAGGGRRGGGRDLPPPVPAVSTPNADDRFRRFCLMLRRAALMLVRWIETEYPDCVKPSD